MTPGSAKHRFSVRTSPDQFRERDRLVLCRALVLASRFTVAPDLCVDRVAEAEPLVTQLVDILGLQPVGRSVYVADGLEKTERKQGVNCGKHRCAYETTWPAAAAPCATARVGRPS